MQASTAFQIKVDNITYTITNQPTGKFVLQQGDSNTSTSPRVHYANFEQAFSMLTNQCQWVLGSPIVIADEFKETILQILVLELNNQKIDLSFFAPVQSLWEEQLQVQFEFRFYPTLSHLQSITIELFDGIHTEYDYSNYSGEYFSDSRRSDDLKLFQKTAKRAFKTINCEGTLTYSGSTIIINNEKGNTLYAFSSNQAFVSTAPLMSKNKAWFYVPV